MSWAIDFFKNLVATGSLTLGNIVQMECLWFVFSPLIQCELDRLTEEWNAHKMRKSNLSLISEIPDKLYFFPESQEYEQCWKNVVMAVVNEVVNESTRHLDFLSIQTAIEPDLVNYFNYLVQVMNCTHQRHGREQRNCINILLNPQLWYNFWKYYECRIEIETLLKDM